MHVYRSIVCRTLTGFKFNSHKLLIYTLSAISAQCKIYVHNSYRDILEETTATIEIRGWILEGSSIMTLNNVSIYSACGMAIQWCGCVPCACMQEFIEVYVAKL